MMVGDKFQMAFLSYWGFYSLYCLSSYSSDFLVMHSVYSLCTPEVPKTALDRVLVIPVIGRKEVYS